MSNKKSDQQVNFIGHLGELRTRLIKSFIFFIVAFIISYIYSEKIYSFLVQPYSSAIIENNLDRRLIFTALHEAFLTYLKVAFFASSCIAILPTSAVDSKLKKNFIANGIIK